MRADLHMHSVFSDGKYSPAALAKMCKTAGISLFSLTDHDNMEGAEEAAEAAKLLGLHFVRGWEISAYEGASKVHILGYGCTRGEAYDSFMRERFEGARIRAAEMLEKANRYFGLDVTLNDVEAYHARKSTPLHTMHITSAFAERLSRPKGEIYEEVFARGGVAFSDACRPTPEDAVNVIHRTGGLAVLAHPGRILDLTEGEVKLYFATQDTAVRRALAEKSAKNRLALMDRLVAIGLDGIECIYTTHTAIETEYFHGYASAHGLWETGGSDFHYEGRQNVLGLPAFEPDDAFQERLLRLAGSV